MQRKFPVLLFVGFSFLLFIFYSCKKEQNKPEVVWKSKRYEGNYAGSESCWPSGSQANTIQITAVSDTILTLSNLYGSGKSFSGFINGDTCTIPPQVYYNGGGNALMQGSCILMSDTVSLALIITTFSHRETCKALLVKQ